MPLACSVDITSLQRLVIRLKLIDLEKEQQRLRDEIAG
jgi:hypothetical protein